MRTDDTVRTPTSSQRISRWGIVNAWLGKSMSRTIELRVGINGLRVVAIDGLDHSAEDVKVDEDPSVAALRALERLYPPKSDR